MNCFEFFYMYRDENNFKFRGSVLITNNIDLQELSLYLFSGEYFIPAKVGLPSFVPTDRTIYDHDLHEIEEISPSSQCENPISTPVLIRKFREASERGWFYG